MERVKGVLALSAQELNAAACHISKHAHEATVADEEVRERSRQPLIASKIRRTIFTPNSKGISKKRSR